MTHRDRTRAIASTRSTGSRQSRKCASSRPAATAHRSPSARTRSAARPSWTLGTNAESPHHEELDEVRQVEPGMADHGRDDTAADEVDDAPDRAECTDGNHGVPALLPVTQTEEHAV